MFRTRLAPTPSGSLHIGNVYSFIYTWLVTRRNSGNLRLRIDDFDDARVKEVYIDDIFRTLDWLGLDYDCGPSGTSDFVSNHSQQHRLEMYDEALQKISDHKSAVFYCDCSRQQISKASQEGQYTGKCYKHTSPKKDAAVRLKTSKGTMVEIPDLCGTKKMVDLYLENRDCVIWRKDNLPAYQLVSLVDDHFYDINLVIRGEDLLPSSGIQVFLSHYLPGNNFSKASFIHHNLIKENNVKLSKSRNANSVKDQFGTPKHVYIYIGKLLGLTKKESETLPLLLEHFKSNFNEDIKSQKQ